MTSRSEMIDAFTFDDDGLIPAIAQDYNTGEIRMLAYMNRESIQKTVETGYAHYWSRSREELWKKGETSGNLQTVRSIRADCDRDTILLLIEQEGVACHTGERNCFFNELDQENSQWVEVEPFPSHSIGAVLSEVESIIDRRDSDRPDDSYTVDLLEGQSGKTPRDTVLEKLGEEATELILASKNNDGLDLTEEISDMLYHLLVLLHMHDLELEDLADELSQRLLE